MLDKQEIIIIEKNKIGKYRKPKDCFYYSTEIKGTCAETQIAALLGIDTKDVFKKWGVKEKDFRHDTRQKETKEILSLFGYTTMQKSAKTDKKILSECNLAILRVSFGDPNQHWMLTTKYSHYLALKRMPCGERYIFDNFETFDDKQVNGMWIEEQEYYKKIMKTEKMFITSFLEIKEKH